MARRAADGPAVLPFRADMSLKVLCAGCSQEERERVESDVRRALGAHLQDEAWTVSLVKVNDRWSVTVSSPKRTTVTSVAPEGGVGQAVSDAVAGGPAPAPPAAPKAAAPPAAPPSKAAAHAPTTKGPAPAPRPAAPPAPSHAAGTQRVRHQCGSCREAFVVTYEAGADEGEETVAVACPHCWHKNYVLIAESAAESRDFTAEKA
jgi:hypothetical protein